MDKPYYYANKKRISLEPTDDFFAVDVREFHDERDSGLRSAVERTGQHLRRGYYLLKPGQLPAGDVAQLKQHGLIRPVFRHGDHLVVVLPEIRMQESRGEVVSGLEAWLSNQSEEAQVVKSVGDQVTLRSGSSDDTLSLANKIYEQLGPQVVEPRMLQLLDRTTPGTRGKSNRPSE